MATPKLSSSHAPTSLQWNPPGSETPPPQKPGSVPFLWEEKPGKPKKHTSTSLFGHFSNTSSTDGVGPLSARSLELPPRLVAEMNKAMQRHGDFDSPRTVLDGPDLSKPGTARVHVPCHSFSYYREGKKRTKREKEARFWRRKKNITEDDEQQGEESKITTTPTLSRNSSLNSLSTPHHSSHFWASIRENLKQVVAWRKYGKTR